MEQLTESFYNKYFKEYIKDNKANEKKFSLELNSKISSLLITNYGNESEKNLLIDSLIKYCNPIVTKLILIDLDHFNFNNYYGIPNLLTPITTDIKMANFVISKLMIEQQNRYDVFSEKRVKSIESYNDLVERYNIDKCFKNKLRYMPYIIVVVDEIFEVLRNKEINNNLMKILLNGERAGIKIIAFSKVNKRSLNLGNFSDLIKNVNAFNLSSLIDGTYQENNELDSMNGFDFERYSAEILKANGFTKVEVTQCSSDFGVDIVAYKDDIKYAIQCKKYSSPVGIKAVQEVIGSRVMNDCHVAVVLTNNTFTNSAKELAKKNNVLLWDGNKLEQLIKCYNNQF